MLEWVDVDDAYLDYLRQNADPRIPHSNYGVDHYKPFFGVLFYTGDFAYVAAVSHPKPRHHQMKSSLDFIKVYDHNTLLCVVNLNYMFPIHASSLKRLLYSNIHQYRTFTSPQEESAYIALLTRELTCLRRSNVQSNAKKVYAQCTQGLNLPLIKRSFDFKQLEAACMQYNTI